MTPVEAVSFDASAQGCTALEDVLTLINEKSDAHDRLIVVFDEFQEIANLDPGTDKLLRAVMQLHKSLNYLFLGSEESMMTAIFEDIKSPFFHFGALMHLGKIPYQDFYDFLTERFAVIRKEQAAEDARQILDLTKCHPFYTQQLAAVFWDLCVPPRIRRPFQLLPTPALKKDGIIVRDDDSALEDPFSALLIRRSKQQAAIGLSPVG